MQSKSDATKAKTPPKADLAVEIAFYEGLRSQLPTDVELLKLLGDDYTKVGRWEDGLAVDLDLVKALPGEALVHYNLACSLSLLQRLEAASGALELAIDLGYRDWNWLRRDPDLENIRKSPFFARIKTKMTPGAQTGPHS